MANKRWNVNPRFVICEDAGAVTAIPSGAYPIGSIMFRMDEQLFYQWDGDSWNSFSGSISSLDDIPGVDLSTDTPDNNDVLTYTTSGNKWVPAPPPGAGGGEANTVTNVGTGEGTLAKPKVGVDIPLKSLKQGTNVTLTNNTNDVTITSAYPPDASDTVKGIVELSLANGSESGGGRAVQDSDVRLTNARTPTTHKDTHKSGQSDGFTKSDVLSVTSRYIEDVADMASDSRRIWIEDTTNNLKYWSDEASPVKHVVERQANKGAASGYASLDSGTKVPVTQLPDATTTAKGISELATDGENASGVVVQGNDARLSNARTPTTHAASHKSGGGDSIKLDELATPTDVTTLNSSTSAHGLMKKLSNVATEYMDGTGNWSTPAGGGGGGSGSLKSGTVQRSGDGSTTVFTITHGFGSTPEGVIVIPKTAAAFGAHDTAVNGTVITITYTTAPITGTNNLEFWWLVCDDSLTGGGGAALTADDLTDITNISPAVNQTFVYQTGSGTFENKKLKTRQWMTTTINTTSNSTRYSGWGAAAGTLTTEANIKTPIFSAMTLKRVIIKIPSNGKDATVNFSIRKNEADVSGTTHSVAAGVTTAFDSGELSVAFASGDFIAVKCDLTTSANGSTLGAIITTEYETEAYA